GSKAHAGQRRLGDGREAHAHRAELLDRVAGEIRGHRDDLRVVPHLLGHRFLERPLKRDLAHAGSSQGHLANMSTSKSFGSGTGLCSAKATASLRSPRTRSWIAPISTAESRPCPSAYRSSRAMGSRAFHAAISSAGRVSGGMAARMAWKYQR